MHGSSGQGEGTNGGRLRVFSSAQAPWRMLLQALDRHQILESGIWERGNRGTNAFRYRPKFAWLGIANG